MGRCVVAVLCKPVKFVRFSWCFISTRQQCFLHHQLIDITSAIVPRNRTAWGMCSPGGLMLVTGDDIPSEDYEHELKIAWYTPDFPCMEREGLQISTEYLSKIICAICLFRLKSILDCTISYLCFMKSNLLPRYQLVLKSVTYLNSDINVKGMSWTMIQNARHKPFPEE